MLNQPAVCLISYFNRETEKKICQSQPKNSDISSSSLYYCFNCAGSLRWFTSEMFNYQKDKQAWSLKRKRQPGPAAMLLVWHTSRLMLQTFRRLYGLVLIRSAVFAINPLRCNHTHTRLRSSFRHPESRRIKMWDDGSVFPSSTKVSRGFPARCHFCVYICMWPRKTKRKHELCPKSNPDLSDQSPLGWGAAA